MYNHKIDVGCSLRWFMIYGLNTYVVAPFAYVNHQGFYYQHQLSKIRGYLCGGDGGVRSLYQYAYL